MPQQNSNLKFGIGIVFVLIGTLICFNLFLLVVGVPVFFVGVILVLLSKKPFLVKSLSIFVPVILWCAGFAVMGYIINKKTAITVVVPNGFIGQVRVVYGEKGGIVPKDVDGRMELEIPENGILIIQPHLESGLDDIIYYYEDDKGKRYQINQMKNPNDKTVKRPVVYFEGTASSTNEESGNAPAPDYLYNSFYVLQNDSDNLASQVEEMKNNPLTDSLVKISRQLE